MRPTAWPRATGLRGRSAPASRLETRRGHGSSGSPGTSCGASEPAPRALTLAVESSHATTGAADSVIAAALSELSPLDQEIVTMLSWDGLPPREVASILGLSPNVVRVRAHRARNRLRLRLAGGSVSGDADALDLPSAAGGREE